VKRTVYEASQSSRQFLRGKSKILTSTLFSNTITTTVENSQL